MFRASDIFGRKPGAVTNRPTVPAKEDSGAAQKRPLDGFGGPTAKVWDPATGKYREEELPAELQELMGMKPKKTKTSTQIKEESWGQSRKPPAKTLGPSTVGLAPEKKGARAPNAKEIDTSA